MSSIEITHSLLNQSAEGVHSLRVDESVSCYAAISTFNVNSRYLTLVFKYRIIMFRLPVYTMCMQKTSWSDLPAWPIIVRDLVVFILVEEVAFYYSHRRLVRPTHTPYYIFLLSRIT